MLMKDLKINFFYNLEIHLSTDRHKLAFLIRRIIPVFYVNISVAGIFQSLSITDGEKYFQVF